MRAGVFWTVIVLASLSGLAGAQTTPKAAAPHVIVRNALTAPDLAASASQGGAPAVAPAPLPTLPPWPAPLGPTDQEARACRQVCAQSYYFCAAGGVAPDCPGSWSQCAAGCGAPDFSPVPAASAETLPPM
jgi:hypothetical protein